MPQTYAQIQAQIKKLEEKADTARRKEAEGVIARIKEAIDAYALTPADLFGPRRVKTAPRKAKKGAGKAKYSDGQGRTWSGFGRKPGWFVDAIAAGKKPEDLLAR